MAEDSPKPDRRWREIAEEVSRECDSNKVPELSQELIKALDKESKHLPHTREREKEQVRRKSA